MEQLNGIQSSFLAIEQSVMPLVVSSVGIYRASDKTDFPVIRQAFLNGIARFPVFRRRLLSVPAGLDHPYWIEDPDFDVDCHLQQIALPKPGNWHQFYLQIARLQATPMHRDRPLWQAFVIDGLDSLSGIPKGSFAIIMRVHRAIADNGTLNEMMMRMHSLDATLPVAGGSSVCTREIRPGNGQLLTSALRNHASRWWSGGSIVRRSYARYSRQRKAALDMPELPPLPATRFNCSPSTFRVVCHLPISLHDCEQMREQVPGSTLADVVLTLIGGGLRNYLLRKGELPVQSLIASLPQRLSGELHKPSKKGAAGNVRIALHSDCERPLERLRRLQQENMAARARDPAADLALLNDSSELLLPALLKLGGSGYVRLGVRAPLAHNTYINGVYGSDHSLYFAGAEMLQSFALAPLLPGSALTHSISRWGGSLTLGINACREALPDPDGYLKSLQEAWQSMRDTLLPGDSTTSIEDDLVESA